MSRSTGRTRATRSAVPNRPRRFWSTTQPTYMDVLASVAGGRKPVATTSPSMYSSVKLLRPQNLVVKLATS
jgi:hypothetical protein